MNILDFLAKYGPHIVGIICLVSGMMFFFMRLVVSRLYSGMDAMFVKFDLMDKRVRNLELLAAKHSDKTEIVAKMMGK